MNDQERIKELEYLNNEHRGVIGILMDEREVLREKIAELEKLLSEMKYEKSSGAYQGKYLEQYWVVPQTKPLSDEEIVYLAKRFEGVWDGAVDYKRFARAIEAKVRGDK